MLSTLLFRRQLFMLKNCNKANFSMVCNGNRVPAVLINSPMIKYNNGATIMLNKQQFRSLWHSSPIQNASDNESYINLDHLWAAKPAAAIGGTQKQPRNGDRWTKLREEGKEKNLGIAATTAGTYLAVKSIRYGGEQQQQPKWLNIRYRMGRSGQKFLQFNKNVAGISTRDFPNILVPEDVFAFVRAMDEVLNAVETNRDKIEAQTKANNPNQQQIVLHTAKAEGTNYDFELELCLGRFLFVRMRTVPNQQKPDHKPRSLDVPIGIFHGLRRAVGEVFVRNGERAVHQQLGEPHILLGWLK